MDKEESDAASEFKTAQPGILDSAARFLSLLLSSRIWYDSQQQQCIFVLELLFCSSPLL